MKICGNCDWASGGAIKRVFCEKRMGLVLITNNCPHWRTRVLPEGFLFKSDFLDISHIVLTEEPPEIVNEPIKEEPMPLPTLKRKRGPNKPKVIPTPVVTNGEDNEDIFA